MEDVEKMFKSAIEEIERMLSTKRVVGEPITVDGNTLIPLVSVGFGFGAGGGSGMCPAKADKGDGHGWRHGRRRRNQADRCHHRQQGRCSLGIHQRGRRLTFGKGRGDYRQGGAQPGRGILPKIGAVHAYRVCRFLGFPHCIIGYPGGCEVLSPFA